MLFRLSYNLFLILSIVYLPWYTYIFFIVAGFFFFNSFFEGILFATIIDVTFASWGQVPMWRIDQYALLTSISLLAYGLSIFIKNNTRLYD